MNYIKSIILFSMLAISFNFSIKACDNNIANVSNSSNKFSYLLHLPTDMKNVISMHLLKIETNLENFEDHFDEILTGIQALKNLTQVDQYFNNFINHTRFIEFVAKSFYKKTNNILLSALLTNKIADSDNNIVFNWLEKQIELNTDLVKNIQDHMLALFTSEAIRCNILIPEENKEDTIIYTMNNFFKINEIWEPLKKSTSIKNFLFQELVANISLIPDNCFIGEVVGQNYSDEANEQKAPLINELIIDAVCFGDSKLIKSLLQHYFENNKAQFLINIINNKKINNELVDLFLPNIHENIDKNTQEEIHTFLINLGLIGNTDVATRLLPYVKDIDYSINLNNKCFTCLRNAIIKNHLTMVKFLLQNGADVYFKYEHNLSLLMMAVASNNIEVIKLLLQNGADVNIKADDNSTALMQAVLNNNIEMVKLLLEHNADINVKNNFSYTALDIAKEDNFEDIVELLESKKSDK